MRARLRAAAEGALGRARRRLGRRRVNWTPDFMGFGNHLYLWAWAHAGRDDEIARRVLVTPKMRYWAELAPDVAREFLLERSEVRLLDQRDYYWARPLEESGDPRGFTDASREAFIRECLLPAPLLAGIGSSALAADDVIVLNLRRGDFYSNPGHLPLHGIDLAAYVRLAVQGSIAADGPARRLHVVSDDLAWCREALPWLGHHATEVTYADPADPPAQNFRDVCSARRLVLSNSTFSMWGAFVSTTLHGDNAGQVWAPAFFMSSYPEGRCFEYDASWSFVDELRDGWQPDWLIGRTAR